MVGLGPVPQPTAASFIERGIERGLRFGSDLLHVSYGDLRVTPAGVRAGRATIADADRGGIFLFRGGGNLDASQRNLIRRVQAAEGTTLLNDVRFIVRAGSKESTFHRASAAGLPLPTTVTVRSEEELVRAWPAFEGSPHGQVLKRVNGLGGQQVFFPTSREAALETMRADPGQRWVLQETIPAARDQDIRAHLVLDTKTGAYEAADAYVRNRAPGGKTPNLANGGFPTAYVLSPWEQRAAIGTADALAAGARHKPLHVAIDLFPRERITPETVERNRALWALGPEDGAAALSDTAVIGEAASSAGTKGTEIVRGGDNPVVERMLDSILHLRATGGFEAQPWHRAWLGAHDARGGADQLTRSAMP